MSSIPRILSTAICLGAVGAACAQTLPAPTVTRQIVFNVGGGMLFNDFGSTTLSQASSGTASASAAGTPSPAIASSATTAVGLNSNVFDRGLVTLSYNVMVVGPQRLVPMVVDAHGSASGSAAAGSSFIVQASWSLFFDISQPLAGDAINSGLVTAGTFAQSFGGSTAVMMIANLPYTVSMQVNAEAGAPLGNALATAQAQVDPVFSFDPGFDSDPYTLAFSQGIGNLPAVPEPPAAAAWLLGLLVVAGAARRRRRTATRTVTSAAAACR